MPLPEVIFRTALFSFFFFLPSKRDVKMEKLFRLFSPPREGRECDWIYVEKEKKRHSFQHYEYIIRFENGKRSSSLAGIASGLRANISRLDFFFPYHYAVSASKIHDILRSLTYKFFSVLGLVVFYLSSFPQNVRNIWPKMSRGSV